VPHDDAAPVDLFEDTDPRLLEDLLHRGKAAPQIGPARHGNHYTALPLTFGRAWPILPLMARARAKSFADRLPPVVPKEERDISHLRDEMADILYPGLRRRPFQIEVVFDAFEGPSYPKALELARRSPLYREDRDAEATRHHAAFEAESSLILRDLFEIVGGLPGTEVLVKGKRVPYASALWLPLFWIYPGTGA
jgi:hypothetical protein